MREAHAEAVLAPQELGELWVWVFDPNPGDVERLTSALEEQRFRVRSFSKVEEAPETSAEARPSLIILDPQAGDYDPAVVARLRGGFRGGSFSHCE